MKKEIHNHGDEIKSTASLPACKQAWTCEGVREQDERREEITKEGWSADEAEIRYWIWRTKNKSSEERQEQELLMSGGSYDYTYAKIEQEYVGNMFDIELDELLEDLIKVLHDVEWWQSGDIDEERYRDTVEDFKNKWLGARDELIREKLAEQIEEVKKMILET